MSAKEVQDGIQDGTEQPGAVVEVEGRRRDAVDSVPAVWRLVVYGFQHVLAFYAGAVVMPLLVAEGIGMKGDDIALLVNASLLTCGLATLLQSAGLPGIGIRLPVVQGTSTTAVPSLVSVGLAAGGAKAGLPTVFGAVIAAGLALFVVAPVFSKLVRFFPPLVTGTIVTIVGITLLAVAARQVGGGDPSRGSFGSPAHLGLAAVTLVVILLLHKLSRGFLATVAVLVGLVIGTVVAALAGFADFSGIGSTPWLGTAAPLHYGAPRFDVVAVLSVVLVMVIIAVESIGQFFAVGEIVDRKVEGKHVTRALRADGLATAIAGVFNSFPSTVYSQNIGLIRLTRVKSRWIVASSGVIMMVLGLVPKVGGDRRRDAGLGPRRRDDRAVLHHRGRRRADPLPGRPDRPAQHHPRRRERRCGLPAHRVPAVRRADAGAPAARALRERHHPGHAHGGAPEPLLPPPAASLREAAREPGGSVGSCRIH